MANDADLEQQTLLFLVKDSQVLLAEKNTGYWENKLNGYGGRLTYTEFEDPREGALKKLEKEANVKITQRHWNNCQKITELRVTQENKQHGRLVHVFMLKWEASDEMPTQTMAMGKPQWFNIDALPINRMLPDCLYWLPAMLQGHKLKRITVRYTEDKQLEYIVINLEQ